MTVISIKGRIYSKKNSRQMIRRKNRVFFVPSGAYQKFAREAVQQIQEQFPALLTTSKPMFSGPVSVHTDIFVPGKIRVDGDNLHTSLLDILEDAKVIADDNNVLIGSYKKIMGVSEWGANIGIRSLTGGELEKYKERRENEPARSYPH